MQHASVFSTTIFLRCDIVWGVQRGGETWPSRGVLSQRPEPVSPARGCDGIARLFPPPHPAAPASSSPAPRRPFPGVTQPPRPRPPGHHRFVLCICELVSSSTRLPEARLDLSKTHTKTHKNTGCALAPTELGALIPPAVSGLTLAPREAGVRQSGRGSPTYSDRLLTSADGVPCRF